MDWIIFEKIKPRNIKLFITYFIFGYIAHLGIWINRIQASDSNMAGIFHYTPDWETTLGRWLIPIVDSCRYYICAPFLSGTLAIIYIAISVVIIMNILDISDKIFCVVLGFILIITPCINGTLMFYYCADSYGLSYLFAVIFVYFIKKPELKNYLMSVISLILSLALYQAYIGTAAALCVSILIVEIIMGNDSFVVIKKSIRMLSAALVGSTAYYIITKIILNIKGLSFAEYGGANLLTKTSLTDIKVAVMTAYIKFVDLIFKFQENPYHEFYKSALYIRIIIIVSIIVTIYLVKNNEVYKSLINMSLLIALVVVFPLAAGIVLLIVKGHGIHILMCQGYYLVLILFGAIFNKYITNLPHNKLMLLLSSIFVVFNVLFGFELYAVDNATVEYNYLKRANMVTTAERVLSQAENIDGYNENMKFAFVGHLSSGYDIDSYIEKMAFDEIEAYYTEDKSFNDAIIENIYRESLGCSIKMCSDEEYDNIVSSPNFESIPKYPNKGSISIVDDIVLVKME